MPVSTSAPDTGFRVKAAVNDAYTMLLSILLSIGTDIIRHPEG
jgi:hypothetical protein